MTLMTLLLNGGQLRPLTVTVPKPVREPTPAERVWAALHYIERNPGEWRQRSWGQCLAGWTVRQSGRSTRHMSADQIYRAFRDLTGLGLWRTFNITAGGNSLPRLRRLTRCYFDPDPLGGQR